MRYYFELIIDTRLCRIVAVLFFMVFLT